MGEGHTNFSTLRVWEDREALFVLMVLSFGTFIGTTTKLGRSRERRTGHLLLVEDRLNAEFLVGVGESRGWPWRIEAYVKKVVSNSV